MKKKHNDILPGRASLAVVVAAVALAACGSSSDSSGATTSGPIQSSSTGIDASSTSTSVVTPAAVAEAYLKASWGSNTKLTVGDGTITYESDGLPNHDRQSEYALPNPGVRVPSATTANAAADPTVAQDYSFKITTNPVKAASPTDTSLGSIGIMVSGATLFNPYEGDGSTVAAASNFSVKNDAGEDVFFLDACAGHPTPMGEYHYHALPKCITSVVDGSNGPSHIIGIAFDGFPIYGDRDATGAKVDASTLDECNGVTSATPEFPQGIYHYVVLDTADSTSSIRCFSGTVDASLIASMPGMPPRP